MPSRAPTRIARPAPLVSEVSARTHSWRASCRTSRLSYLSSCNRQDPSRGSCVRSPQDDVDRRVERAHAVIDGARWAIQPFDVAVWPGDVTVGAGCDVDDDLSPCAFMTQAPTRSRIDAE